MKGYPSRKWKECCRIDGNTGGDFKVKSVFGVFLSFRMFQITLKFHCTSVSVISIMNQNILRANKYYLTK